MNDTITVIPSKNKNLVHVETDLGVVNIWLHLHDEQGNRVERVSVMPDDHYASNKKVIFDGQGGRLIEVTEGVGYER